MTLDARSLQDLVTFLLPIMGTDDERISLYTLAFGPDHPLLYQLSFTGPSQTALTSLIQKTLAFGEIRPGVPALWALLEIVRQQVGLDKQSQIDRFRALLGLPPIALPDRVFVSYSRKNESFARRIELDLQDAGLKVWFDRFKIRGGEEWRQSIQHGIERADFIVFCLSPDSVLSEVCHWELNSARQLGKLIIPIMLIDCLPQLGEPAQQPIAWLSERHILNFTQADEYGRHFKELLAALPGYNPPDNYYEDTLDTRQIPNPFRGLEAFRELDYHYFAGRESAVADLGQRIQDPTKPRLLAVVGASGSGKSSLVRAGLLPTLRDVPQMQWETAVFKPGSRPLTALAERLELRFGQPTHELREQFLKNPSALNELVKTTLSGSKDEARFLLVVDQCEEIFAPAAEAERQAFLDVLLAAATEPNGVIHILLTLRADFFSYLSAYPVLASLIEDNLFITTAMTSEQLRRCIEVPAQKVGLMYEAGLVEPILEAVREQPGALPLLQYALKELYERRQGRILTMQAYKDIGGVQGALATRAEAVFEQLSPAQKQVMQRLLLQLVEVGDEAVTRRRVRLSSLQLQRITPEEVRTVADVLTAEQARLLVASAPISDNDPDNDAEIDLEVSHEALLTHWMRLAMWISEDRDDLRRGSEYLQLAQAWHTSGRRETSYLLMGARLATAQDWLTRADATALQHAFIEASAAEQQRVTKVRQRGLIGLLTGIAAALTIIVIVLAAANLANQRANVAETAAEERAVQVSSANYSSTIGVAHRFWEQAQVSQMVEMLQRAAPQALLSDAGAFEWRYLWGTINQSRLTISHSGNARMSTAPFARVGDVSFSPDGSRFADLSGRGTVTLWNAWTGEEIWTFTPHTYGTSKVMFLPESQNAFLTVGATDGLIRLWDVDSHEMKREMSTGGDLISAGGGEGAHNGTPHTAVLSADGQSLVLIVEPGQGPVDGSFSTLMYIPWSAQVINLTTEEALAFGSDPRAAAVSPDGSLLAVGRGQSVELIDLATKETISEISLPSSYVWRLIFSPDGNELAIAGTEILIWDLQRQTLKSRLVGHTSGVNDLIFSPAGDLLASAAEDGQVILWDMTNLIQLISLREHAGPVNALSFSPDGALLLTGGSDGITRLWEIYKLIEDYDMMGNDFAFSPDGSRMVVWDSKGYYEDRVVDNGMGRFVYVVDTTSWQVIARLDIQSSLTDNCAFFTASGDHIVTCGTLGVYETETLRLVAQLEGLQPHLIGDGSLLVTYVSQNRSDPPTQDELILYNTSDWSVVQRITVTRENVSLQAIVGQLGTPSVGLVYSDGTVSVRDIDGLTERYMLSIGDPEFVGFNMTRRVYFSPDGSQLLVFHEGNVLSVYHAESGSKIYTISDIGPSFGWNSVPVFAYSRDTQWLAVASSSGRIVNLFDAHTGELWTSLIGHTENVHSIAFSPDSSSIVTGSLDNSFNIWNLVIGQAMLSVPTNLGSISVVGFSPDGQNLITTHWNEERRRFKIWRAPGKSEIFIHLMSMVDPERYAQLKEIAGSDDPSSASTLITEFIAAHSDVWVAPPPSSDDVLASVLLEQAQNAAMSEDFEAAIVILNRVIDHAPIIGLTREQQLTSYFQKIYDGQLAYVDMLSDRGQRRIDVGLDSLGTDDYRQAADVVLAPIQLGLLDPDAGEELRNTFYNLATVSSSDMSSASVYMLLYIRTTGTEVGKSVTLERGLPLTLPMTQGLRYEIPFEAVKGTMDISVTSPDSAVDPIIVLISPENIPLVYNDDTDPDAGNYSAEIHGYDVKSAGTYTLVVTHAGGGSEGEIEILIEQP